ncbi:aminoacyl-tRNA deacylase [Desulfobacterales bacterium HSG2]|nr:aminoacyl-tRNA deacylase [Desulfobacterales bacterium HSG2]
MSTRAINFLKKRDIPYEAVEYVHEEKGAVFASEAIGFPIERTIKTLVVDLGNKRYAMALMPGDRQLALKHIARACSVKRAAMADTATAERLTGYSVGGISPFGTKQRLPVVMEESLMKFDKVAINAGQRGIMLILSPGDIVKVLRCDVSEIAR